MSALSQVRSFTAGSDASSSVISLFVLAFADRTILDNISYLEIAQTSENNLMAPIGR